MEFKGTKGKWYLCEISGGIKCYSVKGLLASAWSTYDSDKVEVKEKNESWLDMRERTEHIRELKKIETIANAQLISKAPEMLEKLNEAISITGDVPLGTEMEEWVNSTKQLIKEATTI